MPGAISSVPDGMAASVLAGVNPVYGLYASGFGPIAGGFDVEHPADGHHDDECRRPAAGSTLSGVDDADRAEGVVPPHGRSPAWR